MQFAPVLVKIILNVNKTQLHHRIMEKHEGLHPTFYVQFFFKNNETLWGLFCFTNQIFGSTARGIQDFSRIKKQKTQSMLYVI